MMGLAARLGFRRASTAVDQAGWGRTAFTAVICFIYFFPVLVIILTAFKEHTDALAVPAKLFPTTLFGLIPERLTFDPTLENFVNVFSRSYSAGRRRRARGSRGSSSIRSSLPGRPSCWHLSSARSRPSAFPAIR
jgi:multiple sugar transport system permease protein